MPRFHRADVEALHGLAFGLTYLLSEAVFAGPDGRLAYPKKLQQRVKALAGLLSEEEVDVAMSADIESLDWAAAKTLRRLWLGPIS